MALESTVLYNVIVLLLESNTDADQQNIDLIYKKKECRSKVHPKRVTTLYRVSNPKRWN
jgi:hypothetical protein